MYLLLLSLIMLVYINFNFKLTFMRRWQQIFICVVCALATGFSWQYASELSKSQLVAWFANPTNMLDVSVVLAIEVALQIAFCALTSLRHHGNAVAKWAVLCQKMLSVFPGLLIWPVMLVFVLAFMYAVPGLEYTTYSWSIAAGILVLAPLISWFVRWLLPEDDIRLEIFFMLNILIEILGILGTVNGQTAVEGVDKIEWGVLFANVSLALFGIVVGAAIYRRKLNKIKI